MGEIATFYSYKGGTGRTMALANVAWILAAAGHRVLMVDWDLEAPGLHRYFHPFLKDKELLTSTGIIDLVIDFSSQATTPASSEAERSATWYLPLADVLRHAVSIDWDFGSGRLDLLPAGQQSPSYATRVNSFNWDNFYERLGGGTFLDALRTSMLKNYEYVLIDSRTGVSDTSGICTVQMPDKLVVCFTLNRQSIEGAAATARSVADARAKTQRGPVRVFPVPTRVEKAETLKLEAARAASRQRFDSFLAHLGDTRTSYWDEIEISYQPYYAYEEVLASFRDPSPSVGSVLYSMERLAARLTGQTTIAWTQPSTQSRADVIGAYGWTPPPAPVAAPVEVPAPQPMPAPATPVPVVAGTHGRQYWFYISYAGINADSLLSRFVQGLDQEIRQRIGVPHSVAFYDEQSLDGVERWEDAVRQGLTRSRTAICIVTPAYLYSELCGREFTLFRRLEMPILLVPWLPVQGELPTALRSIQMFTGDVRARAMSSGIQAMMRIERYRDASVEYIVSLAQQVVTLGKAERPPLEIPVPAFDDTPNAFSDDAAQTGAAVGRTATFACIAPDGWEWRPYGSRSIQVLAQQAGAAEQFRIAMAPASAFLADELRHASDSGHAWILLLDVSEVRSAHAQKLIAMIAANVSPGAYGRVVLVHPTSGTSPTTDDLAVTRLAHEQLRYTQTVDARSEEELSTTLRRELLSMRAEMVRDAAVRSASAPSVSLPTMTRHD